MNINPIGFRQQQPSFKAVFAEGVNEKVCALDSEKNHDVLFNSYKNAVKNLAKGSDKYVVDIPEFVFGLRSLAYWPIPMHVRYPVCIPKIYNKKYPVYKEQIKISLDDITCSEEKFCNDENDLRLRAMIRILNYLGCEPCFIVEEYEQKIDDKINNNLNPLEKEKKRDADWDSV